MADEISVKMPPRTPDTLDCLDAARLIIRDQWLAVIDAHRQIKDGVVGEFVAASRGQIALIDIVTVVPRGGLARDETQKQPTAFFDSFAQDSLPVLADCDLLLIKPDKTTGLLKLANDVTGNVQVW